MISFTSTEEIVRALPPNQRCLPRNCGSARGRLLFRAARKGSSEDELVGMANRETVGDVCRVRQRLKLQDAKSLDNSGSILKRRKLVFPLLSFFLFRSEAGFQKSSGQVLAA